MDAQVPADIDIGRILQVVALVPVDPFADVDALEFRPSGDLPEWWSEQLAEQGLGEQDGLVRLATPALVDFLVDAQQEWREPDSSKPATLFFEVGETPATTVKLQAIAGKQEENCYLLVRNLGVLDSLLTRSIGAVRAQMLDQSRERVVHQKQVANISADRDEARRLEQAKSKFLANMSHEVRTPLTTILGMASMAQSTIGNAEQQRGYLDGVVSAAQRLLRLSNDILDLSRLQAERLELDSAPFSLHQEMREFEKVWSLHGVSQSLTFDLQIDDGTPDAVMGDAFRLQQVLANLVGNAMKFTETGGVTLRLSPADGDRVRFSVRDTGVGISKEQQVRIFDTFTQVDETATRRHQGAGLGLAIASNLVRLMGAEIAVKSEPGAGSTFSFDVYFRPTTANVPSDSLEPNIGNADVDRIIRVLIAEDHEINRSIIVEILEREGYVAVEAENGQIAVEAWRSSPFDVIIMDCQMPILSGQEAIEIIRQEESDGSDHVPIIALTAHAMPEEKQRLLNHGADRYMSKPFERIELLSMVSSLASGKDA